MTRTTWLITAASTVELHAATADVGVATVAAVIVVSLLFDSHIVHAIPQSISRHVKNVDVA